MNRSRFPLIIRRGSVAVKIYRVRHRSVSSGHVFTVAWHAGGRRLTRQFADLKKAQGEAGLRADQLNAGRIEAAASPLAVDEAAILAELRRMAAPVPVHSAVEEWAKAREFCGGYLLEAARSWQEQHAGATLPDITVEGAVKKFLAAKRRQGVDVKASYLRQLPYFANAFRGQLLGNLSIPALQAHLDAIAHPVSRDTRRRTVVTLFRWARKIGMLPQSLQTNAERTDRPRMENPQVGIVTPEQLRAAFRLIHAKAPHYIPALTLAALCGMRRAEVHGQDWADIDLSRRFVRVTRSKRGTPQRRLVPLNDAAVAWLVPHRKAKGPICANFAIDRIRDICRTAGLDLADNGFRHAWISARVAVDGDVARVALDAGNSPAIIFRHYRELMRPEEGKDYLGVGPEILGEAKPEAVPERKAVGDA